MTRFLVRRSIEMVVTLVLASMLLFGILNLAPGGPFDARIASAHIQDTAYLDRLNKLIGLDKPVQERYWDWITGVLHGDLGDSWTIARGQPVNSIIASRLPNTVLLMSSGLVFSLLIGIVIGTLSAVRQYSLMDNVFTAFSFFGISIPAFWFGLIMLKFFGLDLKWFPIGAIYTVGHANDILDRMWHLVLPMVVLSLLQIAQWSRFLRSSLLETMRQDYIRTARAKGQIERVVLFRHAFRNALIPLVTVVALAIPTLFGGAIFTETIFNWPGMGQLLIGAVGALDWPVAMGVVVITAALTILANFCADIAYVVVDPRIRYQAVAATVSDSAGLVSLPLRPERSSHPEPGSQGELAIIWSRFRRHHFALVGLAALVCMLLISILAPLSPYGPNEIDRSITDPSLMAHGFAPPSPAHWFGTDELNRDLLSRLMWAGRISLAVGFLSVTLGVSIGTLVGAVAGYYGGWIDSVLMRLTDLFLSFPFLPTLILISAMLHQYKLAGDVTLIQVSIIVAVLSLLGWMDTARLVRGQFLTLLTRDFVLAARALGAGGPRIILVHLIPNSLAPLIVAASLNVGVFIIAESAISFLGVGVSPPTASWGSMLASFQAYLRYSAVAVLLPGGAIFITVMAINFVGDGLRDALDPWLRNR